MNEQKELKLKNEIKKIIEDSFWISPESGLKYVEKDGTLRIVNRVFELIKRESNG